MKAQQNVVKDMLKNIGDPKLRQFYGSIIAGTITAEVRCMSEDVYEDVPMPVLDKEGNPTFYKSGEKEGQPKTKKQSMLVREGCKGRVIATIDDQGRVDETEPLPNDNAFFRGVYKSGLEGSRLRLDGQRGFRCYCGNNSILCEEEQGVITPSRPSRADIEKIAERLSKRNGNIYLPKNGKTEIDGFVIEEIKV